MPESYDAAALIMLAMQAADSKDPADYKDHIMNVANAPGTKIGAGELAKGLADAFQSAYEAAGGTITINAPHEEGKADYSSEVAALASAGGERLVVAGYVDQGGGAIIQASLDSGAFDTFHFPDGMISDTLTKFGSDIDGSTGQHPAPSTELADSFTALVGGAFNATSPFVPESYDAAALIMLAMQAADSKDPADYKDHIMKVANAPGTKIGAGELAKGLEILRGGGDIDLSLIHI